MKFGILLLVFGLFSRVAISQTIEEPAYILDSGMPEMPSYPGGEGALYSFIYSNIQYPKNEKLHNIEGTVWVRCVVETDGSLSNFTISKGVEGADGLNKEALRVVQSLGAFNPGKQNGKPQRVNLMIPVKFSLEDHCVAKQENLTKGEMKEIEKDAKYICKLVSEMEEAKRLGNDNKFNELNSKYEVITTILPKKYPAGSLRSNEFEKRAKPCLEQAIKSEQ